jgi:methylmalonyl-CoA/ethylmalonyl-CoA epimerase
VATEFEVSHPLVIQLECIGQIALTVRDLAESKRFYQETLGMKFLFDAGSMIFFQCGTVRLMLGLGDKPAPAESVAGSGTIVYFRVAEIEAVSAVLKTHGVEFVQDPHLVAKMPDHDLWMAFVKDPSGNVLGLMSEVVRLATDV